MGSGPWHAGTLASSASHHVTAPATANAGREGFPPGAIAPAAAVGVPAASAPSCSAATASSPRAAGRHRVAPGRHARSLRPVTPGPVRLDCPGGNCRAGPRAAVLMTSGAGAKADTMRGGRYLVALAGAGVLAAGCGTKVAQAYDLAAAVTRTAGQTARVAVTTTMRTPGRPRRDRPPQRERPRQAQTARRPRLAAPQRCREVRYRALTTAGCGHCLPGCPRRARRRV